VLTCVPTEPDAANAGCGSALSNCVTLDAWLSSAFFNTIVDAAAPTDPACAEDTLFKAELAALVKLMALMGSVLSRLNAGYRPLFERLEGAAA
jgi:hypothetical protein